MIESQTLGGGRRTQAERRAATRRALLDATIDCLVEHGYAGLTTRGIAERAGVTPGAQQHHFATKAELVSEALRHLAAQVSRELLGDEVRVSDPLRRRVEQLLDRLWELHQGRLFQATMELWIAARTDTELRRLLVATQQEAMQHGAAGRALLFPELVDDHRLLKLWVTSLASVRGLALLTFLDDVDADALWVPTREQLLGMFDALEADSRSRP